jgi:hypothetical protein
MPQQMHGVLRLIKAGMANQKLILQKETKVVKKGGPETSGRYTAD